MTTAVILPPTPASFLRVAGLSIVQRTALCALRGGCDTVVALAGQDGQRLREEFRRHRLTQGVRVVDRADTGDVGGQSAVLLPSDWFLVPESVRRVLGATADGAGGRDPQPDCVQLAASAGRPIRDAADAHEAEQALIRDLRASSADTDGPIARFDRLLSTQLSRWLVRTPLRPNHITTVGTLVGLLGAWCFARGTYGANLLGASLFWCAVIIDGCDGEVARLKFAETRFGGLYDLVTDNIVHAAIFVGLGFGHFRDASGSGSLQFVVFLVGGFLCALVATIFCLVRHPPVKHLHPRSRRGRLRQKLLRGFEAVMNRDFAYLLIPLAVIDRLGWFLWGSVFGTYMYAAGLVWIYRWRDAE